MTWVDGPRRLKRYGSVQESYNDFKNIWTRLYGTYPTLKDAERYTGKHRARVWLCIVNAKYNNQSTAKCKDLV